MRRAAVCLVAVLLASAAGADTLSLEPIDDVSIFEDAPDNASGVDPVLYVGNTRFASPRRCLLRFDLSALPAGATIVSATLTLTIERAQGNLNPETHTLHRMTSEWVEGPTAPPDPGAGGLGTPAAAGDVTWNDAAFGVTPWTTAGGDFVATPSATTSFGLAGTSPLFDGAGVMADVEAWRAAPATNHGWIVLGDEAVAFNARRLHSGEAANTAQRPKLVIEYSVAATAADAWMVY